MILSDSTIYRKNKNHTSYFSLISIHKEFTDHIYQILPFPRFYLREQDESTIIIRGKLCNAQKNYTIRTTCDLSLNEFRETWYPFGIKIVPPKLELSPITVKYWFYGDGSSSFIAYKDILDAYVRVSFCTNSFTFKDCELLTSKLLDIGLEFHIYENYGKPMLVATKSKTIIDFFNYIGECTVPCFEYKWKLPKMAS